LYKRPNIFKGTRTVKRGLLCTGKRSSSKNVIEIIKNYKFLTDREETIRQYQEERRKRREKEDAEREKFRDEIRQKYGIARKAESFGSFDKTAQVKW